MAILRICKHGYVTKDGGRIHLQQTMMVCFIDTQFTQTTKQFYSCDLENMYFQWSTTYFNNHNATMNRRDIGSMALVDTSPKDVD